MLQIIVLPQNKSPCAYICDSIPKTHPLKIKDFFTLIIKLFGLYWLIAALLSGLPNQLLFVLQSPIAFSTSQLILFIGALLLTPMLFVALLFLAPHLTKRLRLDRHFENDTIVLNQFDGLSIAKVGVFIIGGLLVLTHLPHLISDTLYAFKASQLGIERNIRDDFYWVVSGSNSLVGVLLVVNYARIGVFLGKRIEG